MHQIPVIDLFAGPGGLSHGFSSFRSKKISFQIGLSIEKDEIAYRTLHLRAFLRQFKIVPEDYYNYIRGDKNFPRDYLETNYPTEWARANEEAKQWELGKQSFGKVHKVIRKAVKDAPTKNGTRYWILLGGPPCQAYSLAGRSRMKKEKSFARDHRHTLYREYLKIVAAQQPPVFVMENVKGILSSTHGSRDSGGSIFRQILEDLRDPGNAVQAEPDVQGYLPRKRKQYRIFSFVTKSLTPETLKPQDFVIRSEKWGVPQKRHRAILLGVRDDVSANPRTLSELFDEQNATVEDVLKAMPKLRSRISGGQDSPEAWVAAIQKISGREIISSITNSKLQRSIQSMALTLTPLRNTGKPFKRGKYRPRKLADWIWDKRLAGVIQNEGRSHMSADLLRYFFAACGAAKNGYSLKLRDYPKPLLPDHKNARPSANKARKGSEQKIDFEDRFRVQVRKKPATTITSHISKDGHYYIHYDPLQCRSLTVREAARLQTFPDSYFFEGNRTEQYHQVGNAVPSLLAVKLAEVVADLICSNEEEQHETWSSHRNKKKVKALA